MINRHRDGPVESDRSSSPVEEIEVLPDRFDDQGRPLNESDSRRGDDGWTTRRGDFAYRSPRPGGTQVRGTWGVAGTDPDQVEKMVRDVSGMLAGDVPRGMGGWLGLAGRLLGSALAGGTAIEEEEENPRHGSTERRVGASKRERAEAVGYGGSSSELSRDARGKGRRTIDDYEYNDDVVDEEDEVRNDMRRRRRRRRREVD